MSCSPNYPIKTPANTEKVLKNEKVLLICNHPSQAEVPILLASIPPRENVFLVAMHGLVSILPAINKYLIPVYISHRIDNKKQHDWKFKLFKKIHTVREYSKKTAHEKNIKSILSAAKKIDEGGLVSIFPTGGIKKCTEFLPGVGHIIKNLKSVEETHIVMAHVQNTSTWDYLRIIPLVRLLFPKFKIIFSEPLSAKEYFGENAKEIAKNLQHAYERWASSAVAKPNLKRAYLYVRTFIMYLFFKNW